MNTQVISLFMTNVYLTTNRDAQGPKLDLRPVFDHELNQVYLLTVPRALLDTGLKEVTIWTEWAQQVAEWSLEVSLTIGKFVTDGLVKKGDPHGMPLSLDFSNGVTSVMLSVFPIASPELQPGEVSFADSSVIRRPDLGYDHIVIMVSLEPKPVESDEDVYARLMAVADAKKAVEPEKEMPQRQTA